MINIFRRLQSGFGVFFILVGLFTLTSVPGFAADADLNVKLPADFPKPELIGDIIVKGNSKTETSVVIYLSELHKDEQISQQNVNRARVAILSSGIFETVDVTVGDHKEDNKRDITISVKEKWTWFAVPAFSYSKNALSMGLAAGEQDLLGKYKKGLLFGDWGPLLRRAAIGYRDPAFFQSSFVLAIDGLARRDDMIEYQNRQEIRRVRVKDAGFTILPGYKFSDHFSLSLGAYYHHIREYVLTLAPGITSPDNLTQGNDISLLLKFEFDNSENFQGMFQGTRISYESQISDSRFYSDFNYFREILWVEHDFLFFNKKLMWQNKGSIQLGRSLPYYYELMVGGSNLRGYLERQFRGDTRYTVQEEADFDAYNFKRFIIRGATFWDSSVMYFHTDQFRRSDWHNGIGVGVRLYLKGIAIPLIGYDFGWGIEDKAYGTYLHIGAQF